MSQYQAFKKTSTGELTNAIFTTAGDSFDAAEAESRRLDIAAATGINESDLEVVEQAQEPAASTQTIILPVPAAVPTRRERFEAAATWEEAVAVLAEDLD